MKWPLAMVPFEQALEDQTPGQAKVQRSVYLADGALPIIDQGGRAIAGFTNDSGCAYQGPLPVILFGDHTLVFKHIDSSFALGADGVRVLTAKPPFYSKFLFYYLKSVRITSRGYSRHFKFLREVTFPYIAEKEQQRIVALLEQADGLRRQRAEADELADGILPALFLKMFGDPATNPKGWPVTKLGEITSLVTSGLTPRGGSENYVPDGAYFLRSQNIRMNRLDLSDVACLPPGIHEEMARTKIQRGDVLLNITGASIGRVAWYDVTDHEANVNQHVCIIRLTDAALPEFVSFFLSTPFGQQLVDKAQTGATRQGLNHENVRRIPIGVPSRSRQEHFAHFVQGARKIEGKRQDAAADIETLFATMLHRAFTGELTAKWREAHLKEVLAEMAHQDRLLRQRNPQD